MNNKAYMGAETMTDERLAALEAAYHPHPVPGVVGELVAEVRRLRAATAFTLQPEPLEKSEVSRLLRDSGPLLSLPTGMKTKVVNPEAIAVRCATLEIEARGDPLLTGTVKIGGVEQDWINELTLHWKVGCLPTLTLAGPLLSPNGGAKADAIEPPPVPDLEWARAQLAVAMPKKVSPSVLLLPDGIDPDKARAVLAATEPPATGPLSEVMPGDWVYVNEAGDLVTKRRAGTRSKIEPVADNPAVVEKR